MKTVKNLIIGFGKAGKTLAADLAKHGEQVLLVEKSNQMYGGTCINIGCIPSKKLIEEGHATKLLANKDEAFNLAMTSKNTLISKLRDANFHKIADLENVEVLNAQASFIDAHHLLLKDSHGETIVEAEQIFINTGATSNKLNVPGEDSKFVYNSTGLLSITHKPNHLVIVGGGYISLEFAHMFSAFGSHITILEAGDTFLSREDRDIAEAMFNILLDKGVEIKFSTKVSRFIENENNITLETNQGNIEADAVLVGIGRHAETETLKLENAGIKTDSRGNIITDEKLHALPHIWAMGDCAGSPQFTYISLDDYRIVSSELFGNSNRSRNNRGVIPTAVFTTPPLSHVGLTETEAKKSGKNFIVKKLPAMSIPKAKILGETNGILKAIIDKDTDEILGVTLLCAESHEIINMFKMAIDNHIKASYIKSMIFTHPTIGEALNDLFR